MRISITASYLLVCLAFCSSLSLSQQPPLIPFASSRLTHGPMLGNVTSKSVRVWIRSKNNTEFRVRYSERPDLSETRNSTSGFTAIGMDNTDWVQIDGLKPNTKYYYAIDSGGLVDTRINGKFNSFTTLPEPVQFRHPRHNPKGLFNFKFEFGCGNNQNPANNNPTDPPAYATMLRELKDRIHFQILDGDWLYEELRDTTVEHWAKANEVKKIPAGLDLLRGVTGVWENYKLYLSRSKNLANFHREIPFFLTFDDHEILNDVYGCGEVGLRTDARRPEAQGPPGRTTHEGAVERAVFRDPALKAWQDYLGWANSYELPRQQIWFSTAKLIAGSDVLIDNSRSGLGWLDLNQSATLHVLWGQGNTGVYEIVKVLDRNRLQIRPPATVTEEARYSIGANHHTRFRVSNCDFFLLDTRSHRTLHRTENPHDPKTSMLGMRQREWLMNEMKKSDADFFFVVSSVNFMIPHVGGGQVVASNKDDAWTAHVNEREVLIRFFNSLRKPVFVLTGDLHNSFVVQITPTVWEFASGAHNSNNHWTVDAGGAPPSGWYDSKGRRVKVKWSTGYLNDVPRNRLHYPNYCVVQINNAYNSPDANGNPRWVAFPEPQVVFQYYDGLTAELKYAESVTAASTPAPSPSLPATPGER